MSCAVFAAEEMVDRVEHAITNARHLHGAATGRGRARLANKREGLEAILAANADRFRGMKTSDDVVRVALLIGTETEAKYREAINLVQFYLMDYVEVPTGNQSDSETARKGLRGLFGKKPTTPAMGEFKQGRDMHTDAFHIHAPEGGPLCGTRDSLNPTKPVTVEEVLRSKQEEHENWFWCKDCAADYLFSKNASIFTEKRV